MAMKTFAYFFSKEASAKKKLLVDVTFRYAI